MSSEPSLKQIEETLHAVWTGWLVSFLAGAAMLSALRRLAAGRRPSWTGKWRWPMTAALLTLRILHTGALKAWQDFF